MVTISEYLASLNPAEKAVLEQLYALAKQEAPEAEEGQSYGMAALRYKGKPLASFIAAKEHLSMFPFSPAVVEAVSGELKGYSLSKGTIRFSLQQPLPDDIVRRIVRLRIAEIDR